MTHLGLWTAVGAPFVCIEPWHGIPGRENVIEDFGDRKLFIYLDSGKTYNTFFDIEINDEDAGNLTTVGDVVNFLEKIANK